MIYLHVLSSLVEVSGTSKLHWSLRKAALVRSVLYLLAFNSVYAKNAVHQLSLSSSPLILQVCKGLCFSCTLQ
jgi:hypothetical protein